MVARKHVEGTAARLAIFGLSILSLTVGRAQGDDAALAELASAAERILIGVPEKDIDAAPDEQFLVEIKSVLRGTGTVGKLARIANSGDKSQHPRYKEGQQYVFFLTKNTEGSGWRNSGAAEVPIVDGKAQFLVEGKVREEIELSKLAQLAAAGDDGPARESLVGKWMLFMSRQGSDLPILLVEITKDDKKGYGARLIEASKSLGVASLKTYSITDSDVNLLILADEEEFDFRAKFEGGKVRGAMVVADAGMITPAWLAATSAGRMAKRDEAQKSVGREEFVDAASQESEAFEPLQKFIRLYPDSPLALDAYPMLIQLSTTQGLDAAKLRKIGEDYIQASAKWSPMLELKAYIDLGVTIARANVEGDLALEYLRTAEKRLTPDAPKHWKLLVQTEIAGRMLAAGKMAEGIAFLNKLHEQNPFEPQLTWMLAQLTEQNKDIDGAIALYADISALPMMEGVLVQSLSQGAQKLPREKFPGQSLARLWKEKHGDTKELPAFLEEVYEKRLKSLGGPPVAPRKPGEGNRVVLCELLTGSACPPCVGADVATMALETTYAKSEVVVLRYHVHSPAPDPLANEDTSERFTAYDAEGTPMIYLNGKLFPNSGGFMPQAPDVYRRLNKAIEPFLAEKTSLKLDLSAKADAGKIAISAKASGIDSFPEDVHLRLALAEDNIPFMAGNGIRHHEMIVRAMPGGPDGIEPEKGQLAYEGEIDLSKLKSQLLQSLSKIETSMAREFEDKPFDFKALHLVAFLQNDDTGEVLQAAAIPVAGNLKFASEPPKPPARKAARAKAPAGNAN